VSTLSESEIQTRFWTFVTKTDDCWLWTGRSLNSYGYGQWWVNGKLWIASRLAWVLTHGPITERNQFVCHSCDNPQCVRPSHLYLASQTQNMRDMRVRGRGSKPPTRRGCFNNNTTFTDADVRAIRRRYAAGDSLRTLGQEYRVWHTTIADIVHRRTWGHIS
jgi:hypothetical protein